MLTLLKLLQDGRFHSGQALGAALGVSRSAVWKQLQYLQAELNLPIHSIRGRGYCLERALSLLDAAELSKVADAASWPVLLYDQVDSTSAETLRQIEAGREAPFLVLAERQFAGRGRRGRKWISPFAENLYYSLAWRVEGGGRQLEGLSLVVGLAVLKALQHAGLLQAGLKWPNDLLVDGRKIAGVLLELVGDPTGVCHVVIGIGINVNMQDAAGDIDQPWTSLSLELGASIDRNALVRELNLQLAVYLERQQRMGFAALKSEWEANHLWQGRAVSVATAALEVSGLALGVDDTGALRLSVGGAERLFSGGEVSLRLGNDS